MAASAADVVAMAKRYLGVPYVFGSTDPKRGLDCSSLVQLVYKNLGYSLPRLVRNQKDVGTAVGNIKTAQPGDLLVFGNQPSNFHIGIYVGGGKMIAAPEPGDHVKIQNVYATPTSIRRVVGGGAEGQDLSGGGGSSAQPLSLDQLSQKYGYSAVFFQSEPELWKLINKATQKQWTPDEFGAQLKNTKWYKTYGETYRKWRALEHVDPGTANAQKAKTRVELQQQTGQLGIAMDRKRFEDMVWRINAYGWGPEEVARALSLEMKYDPTKVQKYTGEMAIDQSKIKAMAAAYGVGIDDKTAFNFIQNLIGKNTTEDGVTEYFKKMAKGKYQGLADDIDKGMTVAEYADPFVQTQARLLEQDPADVHLDDKHIQAALTNKDPKTGVATPLSMWDFEKRIKSDPRWMRTKNGRNEMMDGTLQVLSDWGFSSAGSGG